MLMKNAAPAYSPVESYVSKRNLRRRRIVRCGMFAEQATNATTLIKMQSDFLDGGIVSARKKVEFILQILFELL